MNLLSIALTLFLVIDAIGTLPTYVSLIDKVQPNKRLKIVIRELLVALIIMFAFQYVGDILLNLLDISKATVQIAGGMILFLIAVRFIFQDEEEPTFWKPKEPFIVPIATPLIAGPSVLSIIMIYAQEVPEDYLVLSAIFLAWLVSSVIYLFAKPIFKGLGERGVNACQRLMGLIVAIIAVQMFISGINLLLNVEKIT